MKPVSKEPLPINSDQSKVRIESDSLGEVAVPTAAYFGPQTLRAIKNFPISYTPTSAMPELIKSLGWVKKAAVIVNRDTGAIEEDIASAIIAACDDVIAGKLNDHFCVDVFQGGAGTSTNMNANEVIANRALEWLGQALGSYDIVHPNDHVNRSQSTNDAYATAARLSMCLSIEGVIPALDALAATCRKKASEFRSITKLGRTQLQDAVPMSAGDEFDAFAVTLGEDSQRLREVQHLFLEVNLGGTAIGTGVGSTPAYRERIVDSLSKVSGLSVIGATHHIEATSDMGAFVTYSGLLKRLAVKLSKICNDLRLLSSGPRGGIGEIELPPIQPGSSIMPGKVNPVIPEAVNQVCFRVIGSDVTVTFAAESGQLQLNAMEPLILYSLHESARLLTNAIGMLDEKCIRGIRVNADRCAHNLAESTALAVNLVPIIGYERAASIAKNTIRQNRSFLEMLEEVDPELLKYLTGNENQA